MSKRRKFEIAGLALIIGLATPSGSAQATKPSASCTRDLAISVAVKACPGKPTAATLEQNGRWIIFITEQNSSKWVVKVNGKTCKVVPMSMKRVSS